MPPVVVSPDVEVGAGGCAAVVPSSSESLQPAAAATRSVAISSVLARPLRMAEA
jgi:hypothetical protein